MSEFITSDRSDAVPIVPVTAATFPAWLERHVEARRWLSSGHAAHCGRRGNLASRNTTTRELLLGAFFATCAVAR